jgi:exopolysaccharide biosynthesis polyprenyl glycosylphosphotransferase
MIKEKESLFKKLLMALDVSVVAISFFISYAIRKNIHTFYSLDLFPGKSVMDNLLPLNFYFNILFLMILAWWLALMNSGLYESFRKKSFLEIIWRILKSAFFAMVIYSIAVFIFKLHFISRSFIVLFFLTSCLFLIVERLFVVYFLRYLRKEGFNSRNILIVGTGPRAENFIKLIHNHPEWGLNILGLIDADKNMLGKFVYVEKVIGLLEDIPDILHEHAVDEVIFIVPRTWLSIIEKSLLACEIEGVRTNIAADFFNMNIARFVSSDIEGMPLISFQTTIGEEWQLLLKRIFDIITSLTSIVLLLPVFGAIVVFIKLFSPGPFLFKQVRSGLSGRKFVMYKFRTMIEGAEGMKDSLNGLNEMQGPVFKMKNDPRVTKFGAFLRRSSMDELPQLFNVLKGDMSIVGPRPPVPSEVEKYEVWQRRRLSMRPGLTCLWQINGRNNVDFDKWMRLDLEYIDTWSPGLDFKILLKTIPAVLFSIGAR